MTIKKQAVSGVKWTTVSTISLAVTQLLKISVLARFLDKTDFGLMAIVVFVLGFTNLFVDMGLTSAILHHQDITKKEYSSLYWLNFLFSVALFIILRAITPLVAGFYDEKELNILIPLMGLTIIFSAFGRQFKVIEQKELNFKFISLVDIFASIVSLFVAVVLAYYGYGVYSLVYSVIVLQIISNLVFFIRGIQRTGIKFHFVFSETKRFLKIGIYQVGGQIINYFNRDLDILIIGKFFGAEVLGGYSLAKQLARRPLQIIDSVITKVSVGVFPKFQDDNVRLVLLFERLLVILGSINAFVYGSIILFASYLVSVFYGNRYEDIVFIVQIYAIIVFLRSMGGQVGILVIVKGKTNIDFFWNVFTFLLFPGVIYIGSRLSIHWVVICILILQILMIVPAWFVFYKKLITMPFNVFIKPIVAPLIIILIAMGLVMFVSNNLLMLMLFEIMLCISVLIYVYYMPIEINNLLKNK